MGNLPPLGWRVQGTRMPVRADVRQLVMPLSSYSPVLGQRFTSLPRWYRAARLAGPDRPPGSCRTSARPAFALINSGFAVLMTTTHSRSRDRGQLLHVGQLHGVDALGELGVVVVAEAEQFVGRGGGGLRLGGLVLHRVHRRDQPLATGRTSLRRCPLAVPCMRAMFSRMPSSTLSTFFGSQPA